MPTWGTGGTVATAGPVEAADGDADQTVVVEPAGKDGADGVVVETAGLAVGLLAPPASLAPSQHPVDTAELSLVQRLLLTTDGTITHILEAYSNERVEIVKLDEAIGAPEPGDADLEPDGDEPLLRRRVLIRGSVTKTPFIYAVSSIAVRRLHPAVYLDLLRTEEPIGRLLFAHRAESLREILTVRGEPAGDCASYFGVAADDPALCRTYRILAGGRPIMMIAEKFPATSFR